MAGFEIPTEGPYNIAFFQNASDAQVQDLKLTGSITVDVNTDESVSVAAFSANGFGDMYYCNSDMTIHVNNSGSGTVYAGGLMAQTSDSGSMTSCSFTDTISVTANTAYIGGLLAYDNADFVQILNCAFTDGDLYSRTTNRAYIGGLVGYQSLADGDFFMANCYVSGGIERDAYTTTVGGFIADKAGAWDFDYGVMYCFLLKSAIYGDYGTTPCFWKNFYYLGDNRFVEYDDSGADTVDNWQDWMGWQMYTSPYSTVNSCMTVDGNDYYCRPMFVLRAVMEYFDYYDDAALWEYGWKCPDEMMLCMPEDEIPYIRLGLYFGLNLLH